MSDEIENIILNSKVRVVFGLEAQGHIPIVERMLKNWHPCPFDQNTFAVWDEIGKEIGWLGYAVCQDYIAYLKRKITKE